MTDGNNELFLEIIDIFVVQVEEIGREMTVLYEKGEYDLLGKLAHKAKSSVAIMGMETLAADLKMLEHYCDEKSNVDKYQDIIFRFKIECEEIIKELVELKKA